MGPFLRYTLLRVALLVVVGGLLWLVGLRGLLWAAVTVAVAAALAYVLLGGQRDAVLASWGGAHRGPRRGRAQGRMRERGPTDEEVEDASADASEPRPPDTPSP